MEKTQKEQLAPGVNPAEAKDFLELLEKLANLKPGDVIVSKETGTGRIVRKVNTQPAILFISILNKLRARETLEQVQARFSVD